MPTPWCCLGRLAELVTGTGAKSDSIEVSRFDRGLVGILIASTVLVAFFIGIGLRSCLLYHHAFVLVTVVVIQCLTFGLPFAIVGFLVGYYIRVRLTPTALTLGTTAVAILIFVITAILAPVGYCEPI